MSHQSCFFSQAFNRMTIFVDGKTLLACDVAAVKTVKNGITPATIGAVAAAFSGGIRAVKSGRGTHVRNIMTGGFVTRLKMEATGLARKEGIA